MDERENFVTKLFLVALVVGVMCLACETADDVDSRSAPTESQTTTDTETGTPTDTATDTGSEVRGDDRPEDSYACTINDAGYCIFMGTPHQTGRKPGTEEVVNRSGEFLFGLDVAVAVNASGGVLVARGTPALDGDELIEAPHDDLSGDEKAFHRVMAIMFPIRNALMYDIESVTQGDWDDLVAELKIREIKERTFTDGATPRDNYYGRQGVFDLANSLGGRDIHHDVMKFLEEAGLHLLCHVTSDDFNQMLQDTHPEGHAPCEDAAIATKIPF
ncbi:MAG: hypothetical protein VX733_00230 [Candidatus Latescibacterota bacterium]|nr:hypothetical protein [Candidatus Latescibacterota bacterium]